MTEEQKKKAIELAQKMGLIVSFVSDSGVFVTDGNARIRMEFEDFFPEIKNSST